MVCRSCADGLSCSEGRIGAVTQTHCHLGCTPKSVRSLGTNGNVTCLFPALQLRKLRGGGGLDITLDWNPKD